MRALLAGRGQRFFHEVLQRPDCWCIAAGTAALAERCWFVLSASGFRVPIFLCLLLPHLQELLKTEPSFSLTTVRAACDVSNADKEARESAEMVGA